MKKYKTPERDTTTQIVVGSAKCALEAVQRRCAEAAKALDQGDYLISLGAMFDLEKQISAINARLLVLREIAEHKKKLSDTHGGKK